MESVWSLFALVVGFADPSPVAQVVANPATVIEDFKADAKRYVMRLDAQPDDVLELRGEPLFHWSNPARLNEDSAVFVWLWQGRRSMRHRFRTRPAPAFRK